MTLVVSLTVLSGIYLLGVMVSKWTNGRIPSALATIPVMLILFWTGLLTPEDINVSGFGAVYGILAALVLVNVGTTFDIKMLVKERRLVVVCLAALAGCGVLVLTVGRFLFGRDMAIVCYPSLAGGMVATMLMQEAALAKGLKELAAIVLLVMTVQGWVSMPVISNMVRLEAKRLLRERANGTDTHQTPLQVQSSVTADVHPKLIDRIPAKYETPYLHFFLCSLFAVLAEVISRYTSPVTHGIVGTALVGITIGVAARAAGLISKDPITKASCMPFFMMCLIMYMRRSLANLSPAALLSACGPILGIVLLGAVGLLGCALLTRKFAKLSIPMAICVGIQAYNGYPINYQITLETIESVASSKEEVEYLKDRIMSPVVIGGVISVSVASVIIGAVFVNLL